MLAILVAVSATGAGAVVLHRSHPEWAMGAPTFVASALTELPAVTTSTEHAGDLALTASIVPEPDSDTGLLDLNTATPAAFQTLPGIGPVLAERIIVYRTDRGRFRSIEELRNVRGMGDKRMEALTPLVVAGAEHEDSR